jgi:fused signal recognition particle receptor
MQTPTALPFLLAQAPSPQPPATRPGVPETGTPPPSPESGTVDTVVGIGAVVLFVALMVAVARKLFFKRRPELPGRAPAPPTPGEQPALPAERLRVELPAS